MAKKAFRAESGLDSGGHLVRNVATPGDNKDVSLGTNIEYFVRENTVQPFDKSRDYKKLFAVTHQRRLYIAKVDVNKGKDFDQDDWDPIRVDPNWTIIGSLDPAQPDGYKLESGDYISASNEYISKDKEMVFILPDNPINGDTIVIKDEGHYVHSIKMSVKTEKFKLEGNKTEELFTIPGSMKTFIYSSSKEGQWIVHTSIDKIQTRTVSKSPTPIQLAIGDDVYLNTNSGKIELQLPKYATNGDQLVVSDLEGKGPVNGITVNVFPGSGHKLNINDKTSYTYNSSAPHHYIFDGSSNKWEIYEDSQVTRVKAISGNYTALPRESIAITGGTGTLYVTLPKDAGNGDFVRLSNHYKIDGLTVGIKVFDGSGHKIVGTQELYAYPKFKDIPGNLDEIPRSDEIVFTGNNFGAVVEVYFDSEHQEWEAIYTQLRQEHVDETNRSRPGVAPLASQSEVDKNWEDNPRDDMIVTPLTLSKSVSTEGRRGVARIARPGEVQLPTTGEHLNDVIVTPKRLNERQATEVIRGLAEIATQTEANSSSNDTHIVTPKKLDKRRATDGMAGTVKITSTTATPATSRSNPGKGVYNWSDESHNEPFVITPKNLNQCQATENSKGVAYIGSQSEVNAQDDTALDTVIVTPKKLDRRRSTETLHGVCSLATQAEANAGTQHESIVITPKTLHGRKATESMWGLTEIATQTEVNSGTSDFHFITPLKFKTWLLADHFTPIEASGIRRSGNLWNKVTLDITPSTETQRGTLEVATQVETNEMDSAKASDSHIITPKKLNARRSTETLAGIAEIANTTEVKAGTDVTRIVNPKQLKDGLRTYPEFNMSESNYGTGHTATLAETWVGNTTAGSTKPLNEYSHAPFVVSPKGLNHALQNYLPKTAKAVDSDKLDGLDSLQFLRSDQSDTMTGLLTIVKDGEAVAIKAGENKGSYYSGYKNNVRKYWFGAGSDSNDDITLYSDSYSKGIKIQTDEVKIIHGESTFRVYHEGHKPTPAEIGSYSKSEADSRFVNVTGDTMSGVLTLPIVQFSNGDKKWKMYSNTGNNNYQIDCDNVVQWYMSTGGSTIQSGYCRATEFKVGSTTVIEGDAKINWNKLKAVPAATTTVAGIVQLTDSLTSPSTTNAATASAIKVLKELIDEKANITGSAMEDLKIKNWLQIGNVILRPNKATKSLDFIWTDVL